MLRKRNSRAGFTLVETIVYIGIFSLIASTLVALAISSSKENGRVLEEIMNAYENP